jgi:kynureninase
VLDAIAKCGDELALVLWGGVNYFTGQYFDLKRLSLATHAVGAMLGLDLAHAVGNLPLSLGEWDPDFACWCNYKYVNAGPGSIAAAFIPQRYDGSGKVRLAGWWGYDKATRFKMVKGFVPMQSAEGWQLSTPSPILYASLRASLEIFEEAGMQKLREKSLRLTGYLFYLLAELKGHPVAQGMKYSPG